MSQSCICSATKGWCDAPRRGCGAALIAPTSPPALLVAGCPLFSPERPPRDEESQVSSGQEHPPRPPSSITSHHRILLPLASLPRLEGVGFFFCVTCTSLYSVVFLKAGSDLTAHKSLSVSACTSSSALIFARSSIQRSLHGAFFL